MSFNVTKKHIDDWYEENRWWADDLNLRQKLRLCKLFVIYQVFEKRKNPDFVIQDIETRKDLATSLAQKLFGKNEKKEEIIKLIQSLTDPTPTIAVENIHPFFLNHKDINSEVIYKANSLKVNDLLRQKRNRHVQTYIQKEDFKKNLEQLLLLLTIVIQITNLSINCFLFVNLKKFGMKYLNFLYTINYIHQENP